MGSICAGYVSITFAHLLLRTTQFYLSATYLTAFVRDASHLTDNYHEWALCLKVEVCILTAAFLLMLISDISDWDFRKSNI